jgi:hypothetical protein
MTHACMRCAIVFCTTAVAPDAAGVDWAGASGVKAARLAVRRRLKKRFMSVEGRASGLHGLR